jgi:hypothetical protein
MNKKSFSKIKNHRNERLSNIRNYNNNTKGKSESYI